MFASGVLLPPRFFPSRFPCFRKSFSSSMRQFLSAYHRSGACRRPPSHNDLQHSIQSDVLHALLGVNAFTSIPIHDREDRRHDFFETATTTSRNLRRVDRTLSQGNRLGKDGAGGHRTATSGRLRAVRPFPEPRESRWKRRRRGQSTAASGRLPRCACFLSQGNHVGKDSAGGTAQPHPAGCSDAPVS